MAEYKEAICLDPQEAFAYANLGLVYRGLAQLGQSVEAFREADRLRPGNAQIQNQLRVSQEYLAIEKRLPAIQAGAQKPRSLAEAIAIASFALQE